MDRVEVQNIIRAIIQASVKPVRLEELYQVFEEYEEVKAKDIEEAVVALLKIEEPVQELKSVAGGYRYEIKAKYVPWVCKAQDSEAKVEPLSRALIETLAIIAYKQPISRGEADLIRGKSTSWVVFQQLEERGWIKVVAYGGEARRAALYGTTMEFLEYFGLNSIEDLPELEGMAAVEEINI